MASKKMVILMADDEADFLGSVTRALARRGIEVNPVSDGRAAVQAASAGGFDAIVLDVRMPVLGGIDALREIRAADPDTPVLLLTGHADLDKATSALRAGASDFLLKPCPVEDLVTAIENATERRRLILSRPSRSRP